jgi:hypothetical protein
LADVTKSKIGNPGFDGIREEDVGRDEVAMNGSRVVEIGNTTSHPDGNSVAREPVSFFFRRSNVGPVDVLILPRVSAPVLQVGFECGQLVQPTVEISVEHEFVQYELLFTWYKKL